SVWKTDVLPLNYSRPARNSCWSRRFRVALRITTCDPDETLPWMVAANPMPTCSGGGRCIRTTEGVSQQIYSLPPLAAWVSLQNLVSKLACCVTFASGSWVTPGILPFARRGQPCGCSNSFQTNLSNHRRRKPADLQSAPVGRLGIPPTKNAYCVDRAPNCQHLVAPNSRARANFRRNSAHVSAQ